MSARIKDVWVPLPATNWNPRDAVVITRGGEPDRRIIYVNRAFCVLTGYFIIVLNDVTERETAAAETATA